MGDAGNWNGRRLHLVGVGGAGMSGLARISHELGADVSGSDRSASQLTDELAASGIEISIGHSAANVPDSCEVVFSSAIPESNPERTRAAELGLAQLHRSDLLGELTSLKPTIAITGTHGKTTTTAMAISALRGAGLDPSWYVGAELADGGRGAGWGRDPFFVVEADESDRSLLALHPRVAVLTNCELDHHATYSSLDQLRETMTEFMSRADEAVVWDRSDLLDLVPEGIVLHAYDAPEAKAAAAGAQFEWRGRQVQLRVPGLHNAINAAGALEACSAAGVVDLDGLIDGVERFGGASRRFEVIGTGPHGAIIVDDYAHHPTEVEATIAAARSLGPTRVVAVFQPHLFSRTAAFSREFGEALATADLGVVLDVYPARESADDFPGVDAGIVIAAANSIGGEPRFTGGGSVAEAAGIVADLLREGDICLLLGAGDVGSIAGQLVR